MWCCLLNLVWNRILILTERHRDRQIYIHVWWSKENWDKDDNSYHKANTQYNLKGSCHENSIWLVKIHTYIKQKHINIYFKTFIINGTYSSANHFEESQHNNHFKYIYHNINVNTRDAPIDRSVIWISLFFTWLARIGDRPVSLTSYRFWADPFTAPRTLTVDITVVCKHVVSRENDSNFNSIQCKRRLIMYLCRARWVCERERQHTQMNSQKCIGAYCGRK